MFLTQDQETGERRFCGLRVGQDSSITSRRYLDCSGAVIIGHHTTLEDVRSTLLTHQIEVEGSRQTVASVTIGDYGFVSSNVAMTPGSLVADRVLVAMGAVVVGKLDETDAIWGGVSARVVRRGLGEARYFRRSRGFVTVESSHVVDEGKPGTQERNLD